MKELSIRHINYPFGELFMLLLLIAPLLCDCPWNSVILRICLMHIIYESIICRVLFSLRCALHYKSHLVFWLNKCFSHSSFVCQLRLCYNLSGELKRMTPAIFFTSYYFRNRISAVIHRSHNTYCGSLRFIWQSKVYEQNKDADNDDKKQARTNNKCETE